MDDPFIDSVIRSTPTTPMVFTDGDRSVTVTILDLKSYWTAPTDLEWYTTVLAFDGDEEMTTALKFGLARDEILVRPPAMTEAIHPCFPREALIAVAFVAGYTQRADTLNGNDVAEWNRLRSGVDRFGVAPAPGWLN